MTNTSLKSQYLLDPSVIFLNHGSFGATPKPVFDVYQAWQLELEHQPVEFLGRRLTGLLSDARQKLAIFLGTSRDNVVYIPNATTGINIVARSLQLEAGDEVLTTDHEYGAMDRTWRFLASKQGFTYINQAIPLPVTTREEFIDMFWKGVTPQTKVIFLSHITSPTALIFPIKEIIDKARANGIITIIDGAHAPGQLDLDLDNLGVDFYTGNLHKWLSAPKGSAFLYARPNMQHLIEPLIVSWGWQSELPGASQFIDYLEWPGTQDYSAYLAVPRAIEFQSENNWKSVRQACHNLLAPFRQDYISWSGLSPISPIGQDWHLQLEAFPLPKETDIVTIKETLYQQYRIEVPLIAWGNYRFIRVSIQAYNSADDLTALLTALKELLQSFDGDNH